MKTKIRGISKIFFLLTGMIVAYSCSEGFFDSKIGDRITPDQHYNNSIDVTVSFYGVASILQDIYPNYVIVDGLISDQTEITPAASQDLRNLYEHYIYKDNPFINGAAFYKIIVSANEVLKYIDQVVEKDYNYDTVLNNAYKGALVGYRSWAYYTYARLYGKVTLIPDELSTLPDLNALRTVSREDILDILIDDLTPYIHDNTSSTVEVRIGNSINTKGLLGEIYLDKMDYVKAAELLKAAIESYGNEAKVYKVDNQYAKEKYANLFLNSADQFTEVLTAVSFSFEDGQKNPLEDYFHYDYKYMVRPSKVMVDSFKAQIQQAGDMGDLYRGLGLNYDTIPVTGEYYISKYSRDKTIAYSADIVQYRASDLHLLLAEALNRSGDLELAKTLLNKGIKNLSPKPTGYARWTGNLGIRGRVDLLPNEIPLSATDPMLYLEDLIVQERSIELAFEGKRWLDLQRIARRRGDPAYLADRVAAKYSDPVIRERVRSHLMNEQNWYFPKK